jgi:hypothetical protein
MVRSLKKLSRQLPLPAFVTELRDYGVASSESFTHRNLLR